VSADAARTSAQIAVRSDRQRQWWSTLAVVALIVVGLGVQPGAALACVGDCNGDGLVVIGELIVGVNIALGLQPVTACGAFANQDGKVDIAQLIQGVKSALNGCGGGPTITLTGSCAAPGSGNHGLKPCDAGTPITVFRCDDRTRCLHQQGLTMLAATTVANGGGWSVQVPMADASAALVFQASITNAVVYRTLGFGMVGGSLRAGVARTVTFAPAAITPVTEAGVELLDMNGFDNYSDTGAQQVLAAVQQATADLSFSDFTPAKAVAFALQRASADKTVIMVLQTARNTPTPTLTVKPTPTATRQAGRFVDNGNGTVTDSQTGLIWEKKDRGGGLHDVNVLYPWAGLCSDGSGACQPNAAAASTCNAATGGVIGCARCGGAATCNTDGLTTIWEWLNQLNAASFAGHNDWRIPTVGRDRHIAQLETIVDTGVSGCGDGAPCVPPAFNTGCAGACTVMGCSCTRASLYWSATTNGVTPNDAWDVNFVNGVVHNDAKPYSVYVRAVRGSS
jgi:uncharacterized protein DUF1566